jgi:hypothetical protein
LFILKNVRIAAGCTWIPDINALLNIARVFQNSYGVLESLCVCFHPLLEQRIEANTPKALLFEWN